MENQPPVCLGDFLFDLAYKIIHHNHEVQMYLCVCNGITLDMAKKAAKNCRTTKELASKLGVGSDCGTCLMGALEDLKNNLSLKNNQENRCQISQKAS